MIQLSVIRIINFNLIHKNLQKYENFYAKNKLKSTHGKRYPYIIKIFRKHIPRPRPANRGAVTLIPSLPLAQPETLRSTTAPPIRAKHHFPPQNDKTKTNKNRTFIHLKQFFDGKEAYKVILQERLFLRLF